MINTWQTLLSQQQGLDTFNSLNNQQFIPLPQFGILQVSGNESQSFLQNLLTNDVDALEVNQSQLSGLCNTKGRLLSSFLLIRRSDCYQIVLPKTMSAVLLQRLSMYILRSKVAITDVSDFIVCTGLINVKNNIPCALAFPSNNYQGTEYNTNLILKLPSDTYPRYLAVSPMEDIDIWVTFLSQQQWKITALSAWKLLDIEAGLPTIYLQSKEMFTPQQVNFDLIDGVSFTKGCYPGQEIVARLHYLGTPSRRLFLATAKTNALVDVGSSVTTATGHVSGHIVDAQHSDENTLKLLVSLKLSELKSSLLINKNISIIVNPKLLN
jgi:folate-binding protein YgfZ